MASSPGEETIATVLEHDVARFVILCRLRHRANYWMSAAFVVLGYVFLTAATFVGILRENGGRFAACCTFLTVVLIGLEQSFNLSESADVQMLILTEAEILLTELRTERRAKPAVGQERLNALKLRLALVSRSSRIDYLKLMVEQSGVRPVRGVRQPETPAVKEQP